MREETKSRECVLTRTTGMGVFVHGLSVCMCACIFA